MENELRSCLRWCLACFSYWSGLDALFYRLNRHSKRIVTFHNVLPDDVFASARPIGCMTTISRFASIVKEISKRFSFSADVEDAQTVTITFDDGFLNQYEIAGRWLMSHKIPAILFVAGDVLGVEPGRMLVTEKILLWNEYAPDDAVRAVFGRTMPRDRLWRECVQPGYREDGANRGAAFLSRLEKAYPVDQIVKALPPEWRRLRLSGVTEVQLNELRRAGWKIGWHTRSHYPLAFLDEQSLRRELDSSGEYRSVVLSYPYGDIGAIGEKALHVAEEFGYPCAVSNNCEYYAERNRYFLPRINPSYDKYELHFELSGLKYFIKSRKLLPTVEELIRK